MRKRATIGIPEGDDEAIYQQGMVDRDALLEGNEEIKNMSPFRISYACRLAALEAFALLDSMYAHAREFGKEFPIGLSMLPFRSGEMIEPGAGLTIRSIPHLIFRGLLLVVSEACADSFEIGDLRVGSMSMFVNAESIPAREFTRRGEFLNLWTAQISQEVAIYVRNTSTKDSSFDAILYGVAHDFDPRVDPASIIRSPLSPRRIIEQVAPSTIQMESRIDTDTPVMDTEAFGGSDY